jgi:hypothetical protein
MENDFKKKKGHLLLGYAPCTTKGKKYLGKYLMFHRVL